VGLLSTADDWHALEQIRKEIHFQPYASQDTALSLSVGSDESMLRKRLALPTFWDGFLAFG
jgi:hypothetical protein